MSEITWTSCCWSTTPIYVPGVVRQYISVDVTHAHTQDIYMFCVIPKPNATPSHTARHRHCSYGAMVRGVHWNTKVLLSLWGLAVLAIDQINLKTWPKKHQRHHIKLLSKSNWKKTTHHSRYVWPGWNCCSSAPWEVIGRQCLSCFCCLHLSPCQETLQLQLFNCEVCPNDRIRNLSLSMQSHCISLSLKKVNTKKPRDKNTKLSRANRHPDDILTTSWQGSNNHPWWCVFFAWTRITCASLTPIKHYQSVMVHHTRIGWQSTNCSDGYFSMIVLSFPPSGGHFPNGGGH